MATDSDADRLLQHGGNLAAAQRLFPSAPHPWIDLSTGINAKAYPVGEISAASWQRLPEENATAALEAVAAEAYGAPSSAMVVAAPGTQAIISLLPRLFPAQRVGILDFTYSEHALCWSHAGATVETVGTLKDLAGYDCAVIVNPNNPDGRLVPVDALLALAATLAALGGRLIIDEAFMDLLPSEASLVPHLPAEGVIVLRSFGKTYGLAGLRLGFAVAGPTDSARIRHALGPWAVSGPAVDIGKQALANVAWRETARVQAETDAHRLDALLLKAGLLVVGGTPLFRLASTSRPAEAFAALAGRGILVRAFADRPYLRLGIPHGEANWQMLENRLQALDLTGCAAP